VGANQKGKGRSQGTVQECLFKQNVGGGHRNDRKYTGQEKVQTRKKAKKSFGGPLTGGDKEPTESKKLREEQEGTWCEGKTSPAIKPVRKKSWAQTGKL